MFMEDDQLGMTVGGLASEACVDLFRAYGVELTRGPGAWGHSEEALLSSVMGFVGSKLRGTCLLACEERILVASCPSGGRVRDWIGELGNQLVGRLKSKLLARDVDVALSTPVVLRGVRLEPLPRTQLEPTVFTSAHGPVLVWVEAEASEATVLACEGPPQAGDEGDVILF